MSRSHKPLSFLDLPVEIRLQIYNQLIATFSWGSDLHINLTSQFNPLYPPSPGSGHLTYLPCLAPNQPQTPIHRITNTLDLFRYHTHYETCKGWHIRNGIPPPLQGTYLSIFLTCRTIHQEAIALLYAQHTFTLHSLPTLYQFLTQTPLTSLNYVTTLSLTLTIPPTYLSPPPPIFYHGPDTAHSQWITATFILSRLPSLNFLKITIWNTTNRRFLEEQMLLPLKSVRVQSGGTFLVCVPWQEPSSPSSTDVAEGPENGVGMTISRRPRNHEPVIEPTFLEMNVQIHAVPIGQRRRKRRCAEFFNGRFNGDGVWGMVGFVFCCPFIVFTMLWDLVIGSGVELWKSGMRHLHRR
ncbi:hypothetical protein N431DRAFT_422922 [Stipitochalara longipes BDJ]|nr:hypothetical protein N431DRAFT_422922 [Stipitochalara longipes BDJ]